jgi:hypothetical protein
MKAAGGVQFNLHLHRRDKKRVWDISVSTSVHAGVSGIVGARESEEERGKHPEGEGNIVQYPDNPTGG